MRVKSRGLTHKGLVRQSNQDAFYIDNDQGLFIVADGMGGHAGGEVASHMCINVLTKQMNEHLYNADQIVSDHSEIQKIMISGLNIASTKIYEKALEEPELNGMGTTATMLQIVEDLASVAHVGDSRLYLIRCSFIYQLTNDHSLVMEQVEAGLITEEEAHTHQLRNVITRSIGYQETEYIDTHRLRLEDQDFLLLCSDGLHGKVSDQELRNIVCKYDTDAVAALVDLANERGGEDNITVVIVKVET